MDKISSAKDLEPLITYYVKEMGERPGKMMVVLSLLSDLEQTADWQHQPEGVRASVRVSFEILRDLFKQLMALEENGHGERVVEAELNELFRGRSEGGAA